MNRITRYAIGLLVEEMGEALCHIGRALRFGLDTEGKPGITERLALARELGDVGAALEFASNVHLVDGMIVVANRQRKSAKLADPNERDNIGRPLVPNVDEA